MLLPLFADVSPSAVLLLPKEYRNGLGISWFPTMTMSIEYKFTIPKSSKRTTTIHSNCTVGVFSSTNFLHGTMGRHSLYTELWTAPCHIGEDVRVNKGWRDDQVCLAVSMQMVLVVPMERNLTKGKEKGKL
ncbi:hypothetical protein J3R30DRAFT_3437125 [Lentinula aciculospora]|uniref:Uncharacterized protein n=1 Tax=Lentinula aciculospora TaxID=153920 RepID=A0A9W9AS71_9AGAR|nr:hypothetical protein J3R30DRAFT_3503127 [Lentinula aciculospora]KAJ4488545.1 hypothetical protein J3R30DRAFT_3437125 [Lentinula aciculospora]